MRRSGLAALSAAVVLLSFVACKDDTPETLIDVSIYSNVATLERVHLKVRTQKLNSEGTYSYAETDADPSDLASRDLTVKPVVVRLKQTKELTDVPFLLYIEGFVGTATTPAAAGSITLQYVKETTQTKRVTLDPAFYSNDKDHDGFPACGTIPVVTDPEEIGVLDPRLACDCNDLIATINPFTEEVCGDGIDNNCTGYPYDENCADCVRDEQCSALTDAQSSLAGIGQCNFGTRKCEDTVVDGETHKRLGDCIGAGSPSTEVDGDLIDNDCDGIVDENTPCDPDVTPTRACYLGLVEGSPCVATGALATLCVDGSITSLAAIPGVCSAGVQECSRPSGSSTYAWENEPCDGEKRPQRPPASNDEQNTVCPESWSGAGFAELSIPTRPSCDPTDASNRCTDGTSKCDALVQCDGLDNDCDGIYDEEISFDVDGDGYTSCGTTVSSPLPSPDIRAHDQGGTDAKYIDCNDNDTNINPGETEDFCTTSTDEDCRCDRGPNAGQPSVNGCGTDGESSLVCDATGRDYQVLDPPTPSGYCDETTNTFYLGVRNDANGFATCYPCRARYGVTCDPNTQTCATAAVDCVPCSDSTATGSPGAGRADASSRPICTNLRSGTCTGNTTPQFDPVPAGQESSSDTHDDCGAISCSGYYNGYNANHECQRQADIPASNAFCLGRELCSTGASPCCDPSNVASCCQQPSDVCGNLQSGGTYAVETSRSACRKFTGACSGQTGGGSATTMADGTDEYDDCKGITCSNYYSTADVGSTGYKICRHHTDISALADTCQSGACRTASAACPSTGAVVMTDRPICKTIDSGTCSGTTAPTYNTNVPFNSDPYDDCSGTQVCNGAGACIAAPKATGSTCSVNDDCSTRFCVDGTCCGASSCSDCQTCAGTGACHTVTDGTTDGSCAGSGKFCCGGSCQSPTGNTNGFGGACGSSPDCTSGATLQCDGTGYKCSTMGNTCAYCSGDTRYTGQTCDKNGACSGTATVSECTACQTCADAGTTVSCTNYPSGTNDTTGTNQCVSPASCNSSGSCIKANGQTCSSSSECSSGICTDGVCCNATCGGDCQACNLTGSVGTCTTRASGDNTEVSTVCKACNGTSTSSVNYTGATGVSCNSSTSYCCAGSCVTSTAEYGTSCGSGDCTGTWACNASKNPVCDSTGTVCGACSGTDSTDNGTCSDTGSCGSTTTSECPACTQCTDTADGGQCTTFYAANVYDSTGSAANTCDRQGGSTGCSVTDSCMCASGGVCAFRQGTSCTSGSQCASGDCTGGICRGPSGVYCGGDDSWCISGTCTGNTCQ